MHNLKGKILVMKQKIKDDHVTSIKPRSTISYVWFTIGNCFVNTYLVAPRWMKSFKKLIFYSNIWSHWSPSIKEIHVIWPKQTLFQNELSTMAARLEEVLRRLRTFEEDLKQTSERQEEIGNLVEAIAKSSGIEMEDQPFKKKQK